MVLFIRVNEFPVAGQGSKHRSFSPLKELGFTIGRMKTGMRPA